MTFNSLQFILLYLAVLTVYFWLPQRIKPILLIIASYYFYAVSKPEHLFLLIGATSIDYFAAIALEKSTSDTFRKVILALSLSTNLGILFLFKYSGFFLNEVLPLSWGADPDQIGLGLVLPVGISFYTFQAMSYTIDVYRRAHPAERNYLIYCLYIAFFPQLVAGPIERSTSLLPQFKDPKAFSWDRLSSGLYLMLIGFFKKIVLADNLALLVEPIYSNPTNHFGLDILFATYAFAFQIYYDFSGYSDIARGAARTLGYDLMLNFNKPYLAQSVTEFWRRWHISLSSWFKDYVYIPLGGSKESATLWARNILIVFVLSGFWHGANWTFIIWGALHGCAVVIEKILRVETIPSKGRWKSSIKTLITFHVIVLSWVFFRADSLGQAWILLTNLFTLNNPITIFTPIYDQIKFYSTAILAALAIGALIKIAAIFFSTKKEESGKISWIYSYAMILAIIFFGAFKEVPFIYFRF